MTMDELIKIFPDMYQPLLRLKFAQDKKIKLDKATEIESLEKTIAQNHLTTTKVYNPNAFRGED
jgi:hypothetical protein